MVITQSAAAREWDGRPAVDFHCVLAGTDKSGAGLDRTAVCARFARAIEAALQVRLVEVAAAPAGNRGRWIAVEIKLGASAHAEAAFTSRLGAAVRNHVPIGIDVMDKRMELREIDMLAGQVAEVLRNQG